MTEKVNASRVPGRLAVGGLLFGLMLAGCATVDSVTGGKGDDTASATQSETAATTAYTGKNTRIVVSYNDETDEQNFISYTASDRVLSAGASLMGWSYSDDGGVHWTYGGKVTPPSGVAVLWGDPAIATSKTAYNVVFLANLALTNTKFPGGNLHGAVNDYVGGACLAKSVDAGKTFANYACVSNTDAIAGNSEATKGHFYDGGSIVGSNTGEIFAAWVDVDTSQIDVYRAPNENGAFKRIVPPFPGWYVGSHPRMRTATDGSLYVAAQVSANDGYHVVINRYANGSWGNPVVATLPDVFYPDIDFHTTVQGSELTVRAGNQFSFDIGAASDDGNDAIRLLYVRQDPETHQYYIAASVCGADLAHCWDVPGWSTKGDGGPGGALIDFYNPEVAAWPGFIGLPPTWQSSWVYHYGTTATVNVARSTLGYYNGTALILPIDIIKDAPVCSDTRGYWGDYDSMLQVGWQDTSGVWMRFLTDSSQGCSTRWEYTGKSQHVQEANYDY